MSNERPQHATNIHVWDDPDSKIHFMEQALHGKDWRTTIIYPDKDAHSIAKRSHTKATLERRGYVVKEATDDCGHATLEVHHIGDGVPVAAVFKELGLVKGTMHFGGHPMLPLRYLLRAGQGAFDALGDMLGDAARANGFIYILAEAFLGFSGEGEKKEPGADSRRKTLLNMYGRLAFTQSFIYLAVSQTNDETALKHLHKKLDNPKIHKGDISDIHYDPKKDAEPTGIGYSILHFLRKYPVQIGAVFNDLAMVAYAGAAYLHLKDAQKVIAAGEKMGLSLEKLKKATHVLNETEQHFLSSHGYKNKGFMIDFTRSVVSALAWGFLLIPPKKHEAKENEGIIGKAIGKFQEDPQIGTGLGILASSTLGIIGATGRKNAIQATGEKIYLLGDFMLFFTKNDEYGGGHEQNLDKLGDKVAQYLRNLPLVLGPKAQAEFVRDVSKFLIEKDLATLSKDQAATTRVEIDQRTESLANVIEKKIPRKETPLDKLSEAASELAKRFPDEIRPQVTAKLTEALAAQQGIHATPEELHAAIKVSISDSTVSPRQTKLIQMKDIGNEVAALAFAVPGLDAGGTASAIYDALTPFTRVQASDSHYLHQAMKAKASGHLGIALTVSGRGHAPSELGR